MIARITYVLFILLYGQLTTAQFMGGFGDGYDLGIGLSTTNIYSGGNKDGYALSEFNSSISIFSGGHHDGYSSYYYENSISIFNGGSHDGYASDEQLFYFIWTGTIGSGWNVGGNWSTGFIPDINARVIIPSAVPNFPAINSGTISIGDDPNAAGFLCKQILIQSGAEMKLRINAFMENYGNIDISGSLIVLNTTANAVKNLSGGLISIRNGGELRFDPN